MAEVGDVTVKLAADISGLESEIARARRVLEQIGPAAGDASKKAAGGFSAFGQAVIIANQALGLLSTGIRGVTSALEALAGPIDELDRINKLSQRTGITVES